MYFDKCNLKVFRTKCCGYSKLGLKMPETTNNLLTCLFVFKTELAKYFIILPMPVIKQTVAQ